MSASHVKTSRKKAMAGDLGTFGNQNMLEGREKRIRIHTAEKVVLSLSLFLSLSLSFSRTHTNAKTHTSHTGGYSQVDGG
jgi:hypothetical protein